MVVVFCTLFLVTACGGGGSGAPAAATTTTVTTTAATTATDATAGSTAPAAAQDTAAAADTAATLTGSVNATVDTGTEPVAVGATTTTTTPATPATPSTSSGSDTGSADSADTAVPGTTAPDTATVVADATEVAVRDTQPVTTVATGTASDSTAPATSPTPTSTAAGYWRTVHVDAAATAAGDGSASAPFRTIGAAMARLQPGDDVVIAAGTYREWIVVPTLAPDAAATRIRAAAARSVTVKGSQETGGWTLVSPGVYAVAWPGEQPEQVFRAGVRLQQIGGTVFSGYPVTPTADLAGLHASEGGIWPARVAGGVAELVADSFTWDAAGRRIVVKLSTALAAGEKLEVSTRQHVLQAESAHRLSVEGIDFAHSNTSLNRRWGAIKVVGTFNTLRNIAVRDMDATCVQIIGEDNALLDSTIERCGQTGVAGKGRRLTVVNNQVLSNNTRGFNKWWEAGGMKLIGDGGLHDSVIRNNVVAYNAGDGIWLDMKNSNIVIEGNTTAYNAGFGVHYEASQSGTIRGNRAYGNTMRGIYLFESSSTLIENNSVFGNAMEGIGVVDGPRSAGDPTLKPYDNRVLNNTIAWNDFDRNWIQLVMPGDGFRSASDRNAFKAERLPPRMSMGFFSPTNPYQERLDLWQGATRLDPQSSTQTVAMPAGLKAALAARRLLTSEQLPATLATPGTY